MQAPQQGQIGRLMAMVQLVTSKLERAIQCEQQLDDDPYIQRLFGSRKSYSDVLIDLCEIVIRLESMDKKQQAESRTADHSLSNMVDEDISLVKLYINRQRMLKQQAEHTEMP